MEATIISSLVNALVQNPAILVPMLVLLGFLYIFYQSWKQHQATIDRNEKMTQAVIDDANARESDYKTLVTKVMDESKQREDKLTNIIDTSIVQLSEGIRELSNNTVLLNTDVREIKEQVKVIEEKLEEVQK